MTGIRTPWSFQMAVIPRLRAISPVRMEFGVHLDDASGCELADEVVIEGAFSEIGACSRRMYSGECRTSARSLNIRAQRNDLFSRTLNIKGTSCIHICLNGMAWWPGNERDNIFATTKRHGQVKERTGDNLILGQGLIGAATLLEKNKRLDWAFATSEGSHSTGDDEY